MPLCRFQVWVVFQETGASTMRPCAVYYLVDPETQQVRYVGISVDPVRRYSGHVKTKATGHSANWIRSLTLRGLLPVLRIAAWVQDTEEAKRVEIALIARHQNLTNMSSGGEGGSGVWFSNERRTAHSARMRERYKSPEARAKHGEVTRAGWNKSGARERASAASKGRKHSAESREKIRRLNLGKKHSPESYAAGALKRTGRKLSLETRAKMSASRTGHTVSKESRDKSRITHLRIAVERAQHDVDEARMAVNLTCVGE